MKCTHILTVVLILTCTAFCQALAQSVVTVEAEGKAVGNMANCREQALTDALREAVRKGAGVNVIEQTGVQNFTLEYDRVFAASFGFVRNYNVLKAGLGGDGIYRVTVRAEVGAGNVDLKDTMALLQLVHLKQSPRVALKIDELIEGVSAGTDWTRGWFEQAARKMQLQLVDVQATASQNQRLAAKDAFYGDSQQAALRQAAFSQNADFIIEAKVRGHYAGQQELYGAPVHRFTVGVDLRALKPDTGDVLAAVALPSADIDSLLPTVQEAGREAVHKALAGAVRSGTARSDNGAMSLFRRIFTAWTVELDLGTIMRLELKQLTDAQHDMLIRQLEQAEKITALWPREFDPRGLSILDAESRLDVAGLKAVVLQALDGSYTFIGGTRHYLQFAPASAAANVVVANQSTTPAPDTADAPTGLPGWAWALIGAGGAGTLIGAFLLGRRHE